MYLCKYFQILNTLCTWQAMTKHILLRMFNVEPVCQTDKLLDFVKKNMDGPPK